MEKKHEKSLLSINWAFIKQFLIIFLPLAVISGIITYSLFKDEADTKRSDIETAQEVLVSKKSEAITADFRSLISDLMFLARDHELLQLVNKDENFNIKDLEYTFNIFSKEKKLYNQIRYIDKTGMEIIRVNYEKDKVTIVPEEELQNKAHRYYFSKVMKLNTKELYVSPLDLNMEYGKIEEPRKPMIRVATPIFDKKGEKQGFIIFNYLAAKLIKSFVNTVSEQDDHIYFLNPDGYFLYSMDSEEEFGFMYENKKHMTFANHHPDNTEVWRKIVKHDKGKFYSNGELFTWKKVYPFIKVYKEGLYFNITQDNKEYHWILVSHVTADKFDKDIKRVSSKYNRLYLIIVIILIIGSFLYSKLNVNRRLAEYALRDSEEKYKMVYQNLPIPYQSLDIDGNFLDINPTWSNSLGYTREEVIGRNFIEFLAHDYDKQFKINYNKFKLSGETRCVPYKMIKKDGTEIFVEFFGRAGFTESGEFLQTHCIFQDITDRMKAETERGEIFNKLQKSEERFRTIYESSPIGIAISGKNGELISVNPAIEKIFGYSKDELLKMTFMDLSYPGEIDKNLKLFNEMIEGKRDSYHIEKRYSHKSGRVIWGELVVSAVRDENGEYMYNYAMVKDITERKKVEEDIHLHESRLESLLELNKFIEVSEDEVMDFLKDELLKITKSEFSLIGLLNEDESVFTLHSYTKNVIDKCGVKEKPICFSVGKSGIWAEAIRERKPVIINDYSSPNLAKKGYPEGHVPIDRFLSIPIFEGEKIVALSCVANKENDYKDSDVQSSTSLLNDMWRLIRRNRAEAEKKRLWDQLLQSQKMESIGRLTGGIAHDFNNILTGIIGYSELALRSLEKDNPLSQRLNIIIKHSERAASLIKQLLAFSRKQVLDMRLNNLNIIIENMIKMLARVIGDDIKLELNIKQAIRNAKLDTTQIEQVLMNLVVNARDAMPNGGTLTIKTEDVLLDKEYSEFHKEVKPGNYVMLSVEDTGIGMSKEVQEKIFEPFFTTKEIGKGSGLGLSTVFGIVKQHNGSISVYSEPGNGSLFKVYFPVSEEVAEISLKKPEESELIGGEETILLVDDDAIVLRMSKELLEELGYRVFQAENAAAALKISDELDDKIDLMITDVVMIEMNGWELANKIKMKRPDIKVLFTSGYMDNSAVLSNIMDLKVPFLNKPFRPQELTGKIRDVLEEKRDELISA